MTKQTKSEIQARLNKGQTLLNDESKLTFQAAVAAYSQEVKRTPTKFRLQDLEHVLFLLISCYRAQEVAKGTKRADTKMHRKTRTYSEAAQEFVDAAHARAAKIGEALKRAKAAAVKGKKTVKVTVSE